MIACDQIVAQAAVRPPPARQRPQSQGDQQPQHDRARAAAKTADSSWPSRQAAERDQPNEDVFRSK